MRSQFIHIPDSVRDGAIEAANDHPEGHTGDTYDLTDCCIKAAIHHIDRELKFIVRQEIKHDGTVRPVVDNDEYMEAMIWRKHG